MKATIIQPENIANITYQAPRGLVRAAGMLRGRLPDGIVYQKGLRKEWEKRNAAKGPTVRSKK